MNEHWRVWLKVALIVSGIIMAVTTESALVRWLSIVAVAGMVVQLFVTDRPGR